MAQRRSADNEVGPAYSLGELRQGDNAAWTVVVSELAGPLRAFIGLRGASDVDATLGDVFFDMSRSIHRFDGGWPELRSWAFTIARRRVIDDHRYRRRRPVDLTDPIDLAAVDHDRGDIEAEAMGSLRTEHLLGLLDHLSPIQREVIFLRFFLALSAPEVASVTDTTVSAVRANQRRGVRKLQRMLEGTDTGSEQLLDVFT